MAIHPNKLFLQNRADRSYNSFEIAQDESKVKRKMCSSSPEYLAVFIPDFVENYAAQ